MIPRSQLSTEPGQAQYKEWRDNEDGKARGFSQLPAPNSWEMGIADVPLSQAFPKPVGLLGTLEKSQDQECAEVAASLGLDPLH